MVVDCPHCEAKVATTVLCEKEFPPTELGDDGRTFAFVQCPSCKNVMLAAVDQSLESTGEYVSGRPHRLWPVPAEQQLSTSIPVLARGSLEEAKICFGAGAYSACAVMCRRAIEAICAHKKVAGRTLAESLKELKDKQVIDQRLFDWSEALRRQGNIGAHATEEKISKEDARDVFDFARAICEYVYVLSEKYETFQSRQNAKKNKPAGPPRVDR